MILLEYSRPFQAKPSYVKMGEFKRWIWGWFAITICPHNFNELFEGIAESALDLYARGEFPIACCEPFDNCPNVFCECLDQVEHKKRLH